MEREAVLFGRRIRELRMKQGMTQEKLAECAGIDLSQLSRMEKKKNGHGNPKFETLERIAGALKVRSHELLDFSQHQSEESLRADIVTLLDGLNAESLRVVHRLMRYMVR